METLHKIAHFDTHLNTQHAFLILWLNYFVFFKKSQKVSWIIQNVSLLCIPVLRVASGPRVKLASCKSALTLPVVYSTDRSKAVVLVLVLLFVALCLFYEAICFMSYLVLFYSCVFHSF